MGDAQRAELPRAHQLWRVDDAALGGTRLVTAQVSGRSLVFVVRAGDAAVLALDVATGHAVWTATRPAGVPGFFDPPRSGTTHTRFRMGRRLREGDDVRLQINQDGLHVAWGRSTECVLSASTGRVLSTGAVHLPPRTNIFQRDPNRRWEIAGDQLRERAPAAGARARSFPLPAVLVGDRDVEVLDSGDRLLLVPTARVSTEAIMATWTAPQPAPVLLRRPALTTRFALFGDVLVGGSLFDDVVTGMSVARTDPPLTQLSPEEAVAAARAEEGADARLLYGELEPLKQMGPYWVEHLRRRNDPMFGMALEAMADHPDPAALPLLLAASTATGDDHRFAIATALAAQDALEATKRLLELAPQSERGHGFFEQARDEALWRTGRTAEAGLCRPGERALPELARKAPNGAVGTAHPYVIQQTSPTARWAAVCEARDDTNHDGQIWVHVGHHGEPFGDEMRPYLIAGSGPGVAFDDVLTGDRTGRYVAVRHGPCLSVVDTQRNTQITLPGADLREADPVFGPPRAAAFDDRGEHLLYLRGSPHGDQVVVRTLATGREVQIAPGPGNLWRAHLDPAGRWVMVDMLPDGRWPRVMTTLSDRTCRGPAASYSIFGVTSRPAVVHRWAPLGATTLREVQGLVVPWRDGLLVRTDDGSLANQDASGRRTEIVPASCRGTLVGADPTGDTLAVVCAQPGQPMGELRLFGKGRSAPIGPARPPAQDVWRLDDRGLVVSGDQFVDLVSWESSRSRPLCRPGVRYRYPCSERELQSDSSSAPAAYSDLPVGPLRWVTL